VKAITLCAVLVATNAVSAEPTAPKATLADLGFIAGHWLDQDGENRSEEVWTPPHGDSMLGMWRLVSAGKTRIVEVLTITEAEGTLTLRLRHFDARLVGREEKDRAVEMKLAGFKAREASFEGAEYSGQGTVRLTYKRVDDERLAVTLEKSGKKEEFAFRRAKP
jgi:uncharacterized protein DUF6265